MSASSDGPLLELARRIVAASPAEETEVIIERERDAFARFAETGPTQSADRERYRISVRVRTRAGAGYREARAMTGSTDPTRWRAALERALLLARSSPVDEEAFALGGAIDVRPSTASAATLSHSFASKAAWIRTAVARCAERGLRPAGLTRTTGLERAIANSAGRAVQGELSRASFDLTVTGTDGSGRADATSFDVTRVDAEAVVERAVDKAVRAQNPVELAAGEYAVVLEPAAVSSILLFASYHGFGAREVDEQSSFLCGRIGERLFPEAITIVDDVAEPLLPGIPFDGEGNPKAAVTLVERGTLRGPVTDRHYARKLGLPCTGHAREQPNADGPAAENLRVQVGRTSRRDLIAGLDRGLLVTQFHYTNMIEPRDLTLTGMTRNGTFWVEGGEVKHAVRNLRFTESLTNALRNVRAVGDVAHVAGALFDGAVVTPPLLIDGYRFTSTTDF